MAKIATHAVVYAQLIINCILILLNKIIFLYFFFLEKEYGIHSFMVQIRDENHKPLPGIELGDLVRFF